MPPSVPPPSGYALGYTWMFWIGLFFIITGFPVSHFPPLRNFSVVHFHSPVIAFFEILNSKKSTSVLILFYFTDTT